MQKRCLIMNLKKWFHISTPVKEDSHYQQFSQQIPYSFYLEWKHGDEPKCQFLLEKPNNYNFMKKIKWKNYHEIMLYGNIHGSNRKPVLRLKSKHFTDFRNISLLKSHLQKCVRRGDVDKAVMTAYILMEKDMGQFLRRLPIIIVEDVCLISQFSIIVWLMVAFPNFQIYNNHKRWLLGLIVKLTQYPHKEIIEKYQLLYQEEEQILYEYIANFSKLEVDQKTLALSLLLRKSYGGLKGDGYMLMLYYYLQVQGKLIYTPSLNIKPIYITKLLLSDELEICSADFHCFPQILGMLHHQYPEYTDDILKKTIWNCSSCINFRIPHKPTDDSVIIWNEIKRSFEKIAFRLILRKS